MEDGLVPKSAFGINIRNLVLILVVMEDGLVHIRHSAMSARQMS